MNDKKQAKILKRIASIRGVERKQHFASGGSLIEWRGGTRTITKDKKKVASKTACRGRFQ